MEIALESVPPTAGRQAEQAKGELVPHGRGNGAVLAPLLEACDDAGVWLPRDGQVSRR